MTAGLTGAIGLVCLSRTTRRREWPLAAMPLVFAAQQALEGALWLKVDAGGGVCSGGMPLAYLIVAEALWPIYAPLAVMLVEPIRRQRQLMAPWLAVGAGVAAWLLYGLASGPHEARALGGHLVYISRGETSDAVALAYVAATGLPPLLSSQRTLQVLGAIVMVGCAIAAAFYWEAFLSVWCFFAASASAIILLHFERARRRVPAPA